MPPPGALLGLLGGALLLAGYAHGGPGWVLGFVALVPWLWVLDRTRSLAGTLLAGLAMTLLLVLAGLSWFGPAIGRFTSLGAGPGWAVLLLAAPLLQPQVLVFTLLRRAVRGRHGPALGALAGAAAWVGSEWLWLKPLGDTLGLGLYPSAHLRQAADLGGTAGLTVVLLLTNEALNAVLARRAQGARALAAPLALAVLPPLLLAAYGQVVLSRPAVPGEPMLRIGLVQANITDIEARRRVQGGYEVVRELLDTHFAMSYDAVERQHADAVLWSETIYPTTFGQPKSEAGAEFDREILAIVDAARVPFVFGTYERDAGAEYNAAAVVEPGRGLVGFYRKTRLFPLTESVPAWLDGPLLRRWLPWAGTWQAGDGARVLPLRLRDGREIPVQPLICRDSVDPALVIDAARLGARALLTLSNDAWFSEQPLGAEWHQAVAAFRSIETRLPQFRVTTNGFSAVIDATGAVHASAAMNERTLVVGALPVPVPPRTLMVAWGNWVGPTALVALLLGWGAGPLLRRLTAAGTRPGTAAVLPLRGALLPPAARLAAGTLRAVSRLGVLGLGLALLLDEGLRTQVLLQMRLAGALVLLPEAAAACLLAAYRSRVSIEQGVLVFQRGGQRLELPVHQLAALQHWRLPLPGPGATLQLASGRPWRYGLMVRPTAALARAVAAAGGPEAPPLSAYQRAREAVGPGLLGNPMMKFAVLPLLLAVPAFHLHQRIAYGSAVGEYLSFGAQAYGLAFLLWWASWVIGVLVVAALLRVGVEAGALLGSVLAPAQAEAQRRGLERAAHGLLYLGLPAWLLLRITAS
ncbi:MAG: apolipoprotein N-acyltransferase [Vitreoscilla sp.]|nr:apolipoprotein N-acyltransferase [Vitreoscilla sp.]